MKISSLALNLRTLLLLVIIPKNIKLKVLKIFTFVKNGKKVTFLKWLFLVFFVRNGEFLRDCLETS